MVSIAVRDSSATGDCLSLLRTATASAHATLENESGLACDRIDPTDFLRFLRTMLRYLHAVEPSLSAFDAWRPFRPTLLDRVRDDLSEAGMPSSIPSSVGAPRSPTSSAAAWGVAYVLEGSRLGTLHLAARLRSAQPDLPQRFLATSDERGRFADFQHRLRVAAPDPTLVVGAAVHAFEDITRILQSEPRLA